MLKALCRQSSTTLDIVHAEDGPPITQRTSGLEDRFGLGKFKRSGSRLGSEAPFSIGSLRLEGCLFAESPS